MTRTNGVTSLLPFPRTNQEFLEAIFGKDWTRVHVTGFPGDPGKPPPGAWTGGPAGSWPWQATDNNYYAVSLFRGGQRQAQFLERWVVLGVDDVGPTVKPADVLDLLGEPTYQIETSPGNEQWGYVLGGEPIADAVWANTFIKAVIKKLVGEDKRDPGMRDVTRYLRLPIGHNQKPQHVIPGTFSRGFTVRGRAWR